MGGYGAFKWADAGPLHKPIAGVGGGEAMAYGWKELTTAFSRSQPTDSQPCRTSSRFCCKALSGQAGFMVASLLSSVLNDCLRIEDEILDFRLDRSASDT